MARACSAKAARSSSSLTCSHHQHDPAGTDRGEDHRAARRAAAGNLHPGAVDFGHLVGQSLPGEDEAVGPKGVRQDDPAAGFGVRPGDVFDLFGVREVPGVGRNANGQSPLGELGAPGPVGHHRAGR